MRKKVFLLCTSAIAVVLEALPYGAVLKFANPEGESWRRTYSYFSLTPFGYANFSPLIVALLTCAILALVIISVFSKMKVRIPLIIVSAVATVLSLVPILLGIDYFTLTGVFVFIALLVTTVVASIKEKGDN